MFAYPEATYERDPFPHAVIRGAWDQDLICDVKAEVEAFTDWDGEKDFYGSRKKRFCSSFDRLPMGAQLAILHASGPKFLEWLEALTGEQGLVPDPYLMGGGIHSIKAGGFLKVHADFNWHPKLHLYRRLNVLLYLNYWQDEWGGALELWTDRKHTSIYPHANTMVVFTTDDASLHGHPEPLACPETMSRDSIALYYYSAIKPQRNYTGHRLNTDYR